MLLVHAKANRNLQEIKTKLKPNFSDYWVNRKELSNRRNCKKSLSQFGLKITLLKFIITHDDKQVRDTRNVYY